MTRSLDFGIGIEIPMSAATETFAIVAKRRVGKSNTAVVMAEAFYAAGIPFCTIDPKGDWYGVRIDGPRMLRILMDSYPSRMTKATLGERANIDARTSTFRTYVSLLKVRGLVDVQGGHIMAHRALYLGG